MSDPEDYKRHIASVLDNYVDGRGVFIRQDWQTPLRLKSTARGDGVTENMLALMDHITGIIAREKYRMTTYPSIIEVIDDDQMLDAYTNVGMPFNYAHWSLGMRRHRDGMMHSHGYMPLAYEIVINSDPSICYCMTHNSNTMMALVIAHAAQGHNAFFKNNVMFKDFTRASEINGDLKRFAAFVSECEDKYGIDAVEQVLDACHALQDQAIDYTPRTTTHRSRKKIEIHKAALELARERSRDIVIETTSLIRPDDSFRSLADDEPRPPHESNLLRYLARTAPHLKDWQRKIMVMSADRAQYFHPQRETKVGNEGFASWAHYKIIHDLYDERLLSDSMMLEFYDSHTGVLAQRDFPEPGYSGINPYALGFAMFKDIERICTAPTDEDRRWFPDFAGNPDWLSVHLEAAFNYNDKNLVHQFLSPQVMRDFHMITLQDDDREKDYVVTAIHEEGGYQTIRSSLAASYNFAASVPQIEPVGYDERGDRTLMLKHKMHSRKPLNEDDANEVLKHVYRLWGHSVVLATFDGDNVTKTTFTCPKFQTIPSAGVVHKFLNPALTLS